MSQASPRGLKPVRIVLLAVAILALCLPGQVSLALQKDAEPGTSTQPLRGALLVAARRLQAGYPGDLESAVIAPEGASVLEGYTAVMLAFFLKESGVNAGLVRAARVSPRSSGLPESIPQRRLSGFRAAGAAVAVAIEVNAADETSGTLEAAGYSLEDGASIAACRLKFELPEDLSFLAHTEPQELPAADREWLELFSRVFKPCVLGEGDAEARLPYTEGKYFFDTGLWEQAAARLGKVYGRRVDQCMTRFVFALQLAGKGSAALEHVDEALKLHPDSGPLWALKAWLVLRSGAVEDALMFLEQHAKFSDMANEGYYWLARHLVAVESGEKEIAEQALLKGADLLRSEPFAQLKAARYYWRKANLEMAVTFYWRALDVGDRSAATWTELGMALDASAEPEQALNAFRRALKIEPGNLSATRYLSSLLRSMGEYEQALEVLRESSEARPDRVELLAAYADAAAQMWRTREAQVAYEQAVSQDPQFHYGKVGLAEMLTRRRRYAEAQELLSDLLNAQPDYQPARIALGRMLADLGNIRESMEVLENAAKNADYEAPARLALAGIQCSIGYYDDAAENARLAVRSRPDAEGYAMLARAFVGLRDWENAEIAVKRALEAAPSDPVAHIAAARLAAARGEHDQAMSAVGQALKLNPYSVDALVLAGRVYLSGDSHAECAEFWARAAALDRWDAELHWELAEVLRTRLGNPHKAAEHYRRHIELGGARAGDAARMLKQLEATPPQE